MICVSQFQTLQFSMTLGWWRRARERDQLYAGADGGLRPLPLGRGSAWRPPTTSYWVVLRENARPCAGRGVGWAVAWGGSIEIACYQLVAGTSLMIRRRVRDGGI